MQAVCNDFKMNFRLRFFLFLFIHQGFTSTFYVWESQKSISILDPYTGIKYPLVDVDSQDFQILWYDNTNSCTDEKKGLIHTFGYHSDWPYYKFPNMVTYNVTSKKISTKNLTWTQFDPNGQEVGHVNVFCAVDPHNHDIFVAIGSWFDEEKTTLIGLIQENGQVQKIGFESHTSLIGMSLLGSNSSIQGIALFLVQQFIPVSKYSIVTYNRSGRTGSKMTVIEQGYVRPEGFVGIPSSNPRNLYYFRKGDHQSDFNYISTLMKVDIASDNWTATYAGQVEVGDARGMGIYFGGEAYIYTSEWWPANDSIESSFVKIDPTAESGNMVEQMQVEKFWNIQAVSVVDTYYYVCDDSMMPNSNGCCSSGIANGSDNFGTANGSDNFATCPSNCNVKSYNISMVTNQTHCTCVYCGDSKGNDSKNSNKLWILWVIIPVVIVCVIALACFARWWQKKDTSSAEEQAYDTLHEDDANIRS